MQYYFAPMEGLTDAVYRELHHRTFPGVDRYYMPFLSPSIHRTLTPREERELPMADSVPFPAVPQLLTRSAPDFLWAARVCRDRGYAEVNLNLGCPSGTVTAKGKGAGMLADPDGLDRFLDAVFAATPLPISIKTRLGMNDADGFPKLLDCFNRYPIRELIVHPRVRSQFYRGSVDLDAFAFCLTQSKNPVCYNGDLCTPAQIQSLQSRFPSLSAVMLGRGLIADPGMRSPGGTTRTALQRLYDALLEEYLVRLGGSRNAMFRLKEHWRYLLCRFDGGEALAKQLRKTTDLSQYRAITAQIFQTLPFSAELHPDW